MRNTLTFKIVDAIWLARPKYKLKDILDDVLSKEIVKKKSSKALFDAFRSNYDLLPPDQKPKDMSAIFSNDYTLK